MIKLEVTFNEEICRCTVADNNKELKEEYECLEPFGSVKQNIKDIKDVNMFIGDCVHAFLDDNCYFISDDEEDDYYENMGNKE